MSVHTYMSVPILDDASMAASFNSNAILLARARASNIQLVFSGTPNGTFKLQSSCDVTFDPSLVTNWDDIPDSSQSVSAAGSHSWTVADRYKWVRVVYTRSSGTGLCDGNIFAVEEV